jgi:hypothetical protein
MHTGIENFLWIVKLFKHAVQYTGRIFTNVCFEYKYDFKPNEKY